MGKNNIHSGANDGGLSVLTVGAIKELNDKFESALEKLTKKVDALAKKVK